MDKSILIVEDESSIRKFVKINLERNGFNVLKQNLVKRPYQLQGERI